jgi:4-diphosphocytidyl-2-C-methyl-D-erythritol kinase
MFEYALQLGSDCPFFLFNKPGFASGRGEVFYEAAISFAAYKFVLVNPNIHISTSEVFKNIKPEIPDRKINEIIQQPINTWQAELKNDFEPFVFKRHPEIKKIKEELYQAGALYASMSGTGSTVFGIFNKESAIDYVHQPHYFYKIVFPV